MKRNLLLSPGLYLTCIAAALAQSGPAPAANPANGGQGQPVSYASVTQLNGMLRRSKRREEYADGFRQAENREVEGRRVLKKQVMGNVDSIQRNLQGALPEIIAQLRNAPEDLPPTFKLYRNLDAFYDVLRNVTEDAAAYGSKDDLQSLSNDLARSRARGSSWRSGLRICRRRRNRS